MKITEHATIILVVGWSVRNSHIYSIERIVEKCLSHGDEVVGNCNRWVFTRHMMDSCHSMLTEEVLPQ